MNTTKSKQSLRANSPRYSIPGCFRSRNATVAVLVAFVSACLALAANAAQLTVTNTADSGAGSLRDQIAAAAPGDTIDFDPSVTGIIALTSGELAIYNDLTIAGPGANVLSVRRA